MRNSLSKELLVQSAKEAAITVGRISAETIGVEAMFSRFIFERFKDRTNPLDWPRIMLTAFIYQGLAPLTYQTMTGPNSVDKYMDFKTQLTDAQSRRCLTLGLGAQSIDFVSDAARILLIPDVNALAASQLAYNAVVNTAFETTNAGKNLAKWVKYGRVSS